MWFGEEFAGLFVIAVGPPIHAGKEATVVLGHDHRSDRLAVLKTYVERG